MSLKYKYPTKEEVPAEHLPLFTERDGAWVLNVDGAADKARLEEFRDNNIALLRERDELRARYDGIDPTEVRRMAEEKQALEARIVQQLADIDSAVAERTRETRSAMEGQLATVAGERDALHARLSTIQIDQGVLTVAARRRLRPTAMQDITARARASIKLVDGAPVVLGDDGQSPRLGKDNSAPMTLEEWVDTQVAEAPHLFEPNAGGGAAGNTSGGGAWSHGAVRNPFKKESWNLTEQVRLQKTDPATAARLRAAA